MHTFCRKVNVEQKPSLEQSVCSTLSSTSEQSALFFRQPQSLPPLYSRLKLSSTSSQTSAPLGLGSFPSVDEEEDDGVFVETVNPAFQEINPALQNPNSAHQEVHLSHQEMHLGHQDLYLGHQDLYLGHQDLHLGHQEENMPFQQANPALHVINPLYAEGISQHQEADSLQDTNPAYVQANHTHQEMGRAQEVLHSSAALEVPANPVYAELMSKDIPSNGQSIYETIH